MAIWFDADRFTLAFVSHSLYDEHMNQKVVWLSDYAEKDIDPYARILDNNLPMPYGFVIPRAHVHGMFLDLHVQHKLIPIFELVQNSSPTEITHAQKLIQSIIEKVHVPSEYTKPIEKAYEHLLEQERTYLKLKVTDWHRAVHTLKHVYAPVVTKVTFLPHSPIESVSVGDQGLLHALNLAAIQYLQWSLTQDRSMSLPSILVQRVTNGQYSGYCQTQNVSHHDQNQIVIYANHGAKMLEEAGDVYIVQKDGVRIASKHVLTQPYKYVLKGSEYTKVKLHEEDGERQVLPDSLITEIAYMAKDIEKKLYFPQKISWTIEGGNIFVTGIRQL